MNPRWCVDWLFIVYWCWNFVVIMCQGEGFDLKTSCRLWIFESEIWKGKNICLWNWIGVVIYFIYGWNECLFTILIRKYLQYYFIEYDWISMTRYVDNCLTHLKSENLEYTNVLNFLKLGAFRQKWILNMLYNFSWNFSLKSVFTNISYMSLAIPVFDQMPLCCQVAVTIGNIYNFTAVGINP